MPYEQMKKGKLPKKEGSQLKNLTKRVNTSYHAMLQEDANTAQTCFMLLDAKTAETSFMLLDAKTAQTRFMLQMQCNAMTTFVVEVSIVVDPFSLFCNVWIFLINYTQGSADVLFFL